MKSGEGLATRKTEAQPPPSTEGKIGGRPAGGFFELVVENSGLAVERLDRDLRRLYVNAAFGELIGLSPDAITGTTNSELGPAGEWAARFEPDVRSVFETGRALEREGSLPAATGVRHFQVRHIPERDPNGMVTSVVSVYRDISDRRRAEAALRESEDRLQLIQRTGSIGAFDWNMQTDVNTWTPELEALYGLPSGAFPKTQGKWEELVHPADRSAILQRVRESLETGAPATGEWRVIWPDGSIHWIAGRWQVSKDAAGSPVRMRGVNIDITDRKRAEAALHEMAMQYKEVFDNISICVFVLDVTPEQRFRVVAFNPAEEEFVGLSNAQVAGRFIDDLFPEDVSAQLIANYCNCLESGRTINFDHELNLPGRGNRYFHSNLIPLRNAAGAINRIIGACIETTDYRRTQEEALAKQNLETLGVLAGGIAHDFNNVLGGIHAQAELIESEVSEDPETVEEIQKIKVAAARGSEIVRELMVYAGQGQSCLDEVLDVSQLIIEMMGLLSVSISKHAALRTNLAAGVPAVLCNASEIRRVVMNLVINASEAIGPKDGLITISTAYISGAGVQEPDKTPESPQGNYVCLEVSDTGAGIAEDAKARIFDPFFSTKFAGRGMGLAVVRRIVHDHHGAIEVTSSPDKGTTFRVFLPCGAKDSPEVRRSSFASESDGLDSRNGTILIVDDEDLLREAISKSLRKLGFRVLEASDGSRATELMREYRGGLAAILLDVTLPGASSADILEEACAINPGIKVLVTSAYSKETVDATFGRPVRHFIRKPFRLGDLLHLLGAPTSG